MGLDTVELVIRFEDAFGIPIPDVVATQLTTPRKVADYVLTQVTMSEQSSCLSQQAFYFLRRKLVTHLNISRSDFSPDTRLENLIPLERRRQVWASIKAEMGASAVPDLARPIWLFSLLSLFTVLTFVIYAWHNSDGTGALFSGLLAAVVVGYGGTVATRPLKRDFRRSYGCAGDVAKYVSVHSPSSFKKEGIGWTRAQVAAVVREIIVDETGIKDFTEDSHFIDDMHLG
jgi:acyl carrier protein